MTEDPRTRRRTSAEAGRRPGVPRSALVFLGIFLLAPGARSQEVTLPATLEDAEVLDKLYPVKEETFIRLANRLVSRTSARRVGQDHHAQISLFEPELAFVSQQPPYVEKWTFKRRGRAQVYGNGRTWLPREGDLKENFKDLYVTLTPGKPRSIRFHFRVHATESKGKGANEVITVLGREELEFHLIEDPRDKALRLVVDPAAFLKHHQSLTSNALREEEPIAERAREPEEKGAPPAPRPPAGPEVTLVRSFKATEHGITLRFRRKWSGLADQAVDGTLVIQMDSSLSTTLHYETPKSTGKKSGRVEAASFHGGFSVPVTR